MASKDAQRRIELENQTKALKDQQTAYKDIIESGRTGAKYEKERLDLMEKQAVIEVKIKKLKKETNAEMSDYVSLSSISASYAEDLKLTLDKISATQKISAKQQIDIAAAQNITVKAAEKENKSAGRRKVTYGLISDLGKDINEIQVQALKNEENIGTSKFQQADLTEQENKAAQLKHLLTEKQDGLTNLQRDKASVALKVLQATIVKEKERGVVQGIQNDKASAAADIMKDQLDKVTNFIGAIPGGQWFLAKAGLGKSQLEGIKTGIDEAFGKVIKGDIQGAVAGIKKAFVGVSFGMVLTAVGIGAALKIATSFGKKLDEIGDSFGAMGVEQFSFQLMGADAQMAKLGMEAGVAGTMAAKLSSEFGVGFKEAIKLAPEIANMSKALGMTTDEGAALIGHLTTIGGLSTETAIQYAKQTEMLAVQEGVAPGAVMKDIAANAEAFARYGEDGGKNLMAAAIQAKKLGTDLATVTKIADGLLDFESSIAAEMEASVMIGRQLNFQKARELALNNDIEGAMKNVVSQLGSEAEFNKLNALQRDALAKSIGVGTGELAKFISNQDKVATLGDRIGQQKGFEELVGEKAMSNMAEMLGNFKSIAAQVVQNIGPGLEKIVGLIGFVGSGLAWAEEKMGAISGIMSFLIGRAMTMAVLSMVTAVGKIFGASMTWLGPIAGGVAAVGGVAAMIAAHQSVKSKVQSVGDEISFGQKYLSSPGKGGVMTNSQDGTITSPKVESILAQSQAFVNMNETLGQMMNKFDMLGTKLDDNTDKQIVANIENADASGKAFGKEFTRNQRWSN